MNHLPDDSLSYRFKVWIMVSSAFFQRKAEDESETILFLMRKEAGYFMSISLSMSYLRNISDTSENCQPKNLIHIASKQNVDFGIITGWQRLDLSVIQFINKL